MCVNQSLNFFSCKTCIRSNICYDYYTLVLILAINFKMAIDCIKGRESTRDKLLLMLTQMVISILTLNAAYNNINTINAAYNNTKE